MIAFTQFGRTDGPDKRQDFSFFGDSLGQLQPPEPHQAAAFVGFVPDLNRTKAIAVLLDHFPDEADVVIDTPRRTAARTTFRNRRRRVPYRNLEPGNSTYRHCSTARLLGKLRQLLGSCFFLIQRLLQDFRRLIHRMN